MVAVLALLMAQLVSSAVVKPEARLEPALDSVLPGVQWCTSRIYCPSCSSCCRRSDGSFGCCGSNMGCCADGFHCCPYGTRCDATSTRCLLGGSNGLSIPAVAQQTPTIIDTPQLQVFPGEPENPTSALETQKPSVVWCDFFSYCSDCTTCCKRQDGSWGCCVFSNGQCCSDGFHCCAYGYHCDSTSSLCLLGGLSLPSSVQRPAIAANKTMRLAYEEERKSPGKQVDPEETSETLPLETQLEVEIVRCDARHGCPVGNTCCKKLNGVWGCCPYSEGQCCKDGKHCCESGYECDGSMSCKKGSLKVPAGLKEESLEL